jgi:hypothetical protein
MDFKNFVDIFSTPKNIGSNKWVLNNFCDLKSSNDYLHIIRLRYDNKWLHSYWDGKLKEVEKEFNFYASTPIKNKLFSDTTPHKTNFGLLNVGMVSDLSNLKLMSKESLSLPLLGNFTKQLKGVVEGGESKLNLNSSDFNSSLSTQNNLDLNFSEYQLQKSYYTKNLKNSLKSIDDISATDYNSFWTLSQSNNISRIYPSLSKVLLAGNLLIGSRESEGSFNTNLVSINNPEWSALDRYFLSLSRKNTQDTYRFSSDLESLFLNRGGRVSLTKNLFFKNSDHSDSNRYLKRGWGLSEPLRLIKLSLDKDESLLFRFRFNEKNRTVLGKNVNNVYLVIKQKKYVLRKKFPIKKKFKKLISNEISSESVSKDKLRLRVLIKNNYFTTISEGDALLDYKFLKKSKKHSEVIPVPLARRLLRTKRTLVLPAHINLTVITNSYDVVHS